MSHRRRVARRSATIALSLPMWIAMILTGGEWCLMPSAHNVLPAPAATLSRSVVAATVVAATVVEAHGAHEAMTDRGGVDAGPAGAGAQAGRAPSSTDEPSHHGGDGGACGSRAMCSAAVAPTVRVLVAQASLPPLRPVILGVNRPASVTFAPEIPPPRA